MIKDLFDKLESQYLFDKRHNTLLTVVEAISGIVAGIFIKSVVTEYSNRELILAVLFGAVFLYLIYRRSAMAANFSTSALGELKASIELKNYEKDIERKVVIDDYINDAIISLNSNTCNYIELNIDNHLCDQSVGNGLRSIYQPFFDNPQNLLDTSKAKFTVGAYLDYFLILPPQYRTSVSNPVVDSNVFIPRDDFNLQSHFVKDILSNPYLLDASFSIQRQMLDSFKHEKLIHSTLEISKKEYSLITAPIPTVCDDGATGVFFMICEKINQLPSDIENLSTIFGRLFSNWISKYNDCIINRCAIANGELANSTKSAVVKPREVVNLEQKLNVPISEDVKNEETTI